MLRRFPPSRPATFPVEGTFCDAGGATFEIEGRLEVTADNAIGIDGQIVDSTAGEFLSARGGHFRGVLGDGTKVTVPDAKIVDVNLSFGPPASGQSARVAALSRVEITSVQAAYDDDRDVDVRVWWTLTHSTLLWHEAKRSYTHELERLHALNLSSEAISTILNTPRPNSCLWELAGIEFEIGWYEEKYPTPDLVTRYPVRATRFVPRACARFQVHGSNVALLAELDRAQVTLDRLLSCVSFLQRGRVLWYERTQRAEPTQGSTSQELAQVHRTECLLPGRLPAASRESLRAMRNSGTLVRNAATMVARFAAGEPFTAAAVDVYLLACEAQHWPSKLILASTAIESLKELFLREQPHRGILEHQQWTDLERSLSEHIKRSWKEEYGEASRRGDVKAKLRELNRPSYRTTLSAMAAAWGVSFDGVDEPFAFISARDAVVHTGHAPNHDLDALAEATLAALEVFERLMSAWLHLPPHLEPGRGAA